MSATDTYILFEDDLFQGVRVLLHKGQVREISIGRDLRRGREVRDDGAEPESSHTHLAALGYYFSSYSKGIPVHFPLSLDFSLVTAFAKKVYDSIRTIAWGEVQSYQWVARQVLGKGEALPQLAARAVGVALHRNPFPIVIPCHRVIQKNGQLGGFSSGTWLKERLIHHERSYLPSASHSFSLSN